MMIFRLALSIACFLFLGKTTLLANKTFVKDASQYCLERMSADQQLRFVSRITNMGASYGHGCSGCDVDKKMLAALKETGDQGWVRRHYLLHFMASIDWKNPDTFHHDFIAVVENDPVVNFSQMFSRRDLKQGLYRSRWIYRVDEDKYEIMNRQLEDQLLADPFFDDQSHIVGGASVPKRPRRKSKSNSRGVLFQTYSADFETGRGKSQVIIDLGLESQRAFRLFEYLVGGKVFRQSMRQKWQNEDLRERLIAKAVEAIQNTDPTFILMPDALFWDSVPYLIAYARHHGPDSFATRLLTSKMISGLLPTIKLFNPEFEDRIFDDFFEVLARVSRGDNGRQEVPILLARLIYNPGQSVISRGLQSQFALLASTFMEKSLHIKVHNEVKDAFTRLDDTYREKTRWKKVSKSDLKLLTEFEREFSKWHQAGEKSLATPLFKRLLRLVIVRVLQDLPLLIKSADEAFGHINSRIREFTNRTDNNVHLLDVDEFYHHFHEFVHPGTLHPSVAGARQMAGLVNRQICKPSIPIIPVKTKVPGQSYQRFRSQVTFPF